MIKEVYLGIDVGSVTTKFAVLNGDDELVATCYELTQGKPIEMVQQGLIQIKRQLPTGTDICGVVTTGSAPLRTVRRGRPSLHRATLHLSSALSRQECERHSWQQG